MPHKCKVCLFLNHIHIRNNFTESKSIARQLIYNPDEFSNFDTLNLSLVKQWPAIIDHLSVSIQRRTLEHAMFFLVILMRDRHDEQAAKFGLDLKSTTCTWPEGDTDDEMYVDEAAIYEEVLDEEVLTGDEECDNEDVMTTMKNHQIIPATKQTTFLQVVKKVLGRPTN